MLPRLGKVKGAENRVEDTCEEGNRSLGKMLQCPVRYIVLARSLADLETADVLSHRLGMLLLLYWSACSSKGWLAEVVGVAC